MTKKVLITGASGFLAYHVIENALNKKWEVHAGIRNQSDTAHLSHFNVKIVTLNYTDIKSLHALIQQEKYNYIIHTAAATKAKNQEQYNIINATYTHNLLQAIQNISVEKFVFISSLAAIGPIHYSLNDCITEASPKQPVTQYGKSKLLAEQYCEQFHDIPWVIIRPTAVYGEREKDLLVQIKTIKRGIDPYIGSHQQRFSFVYAGDLANVILNACESSKSTHNAYNISDGYSYDKFTFSEIAKKKLNKKVLKLTIPISWAHFFGNLSEKFSSNTPLINKDKINELSAENWACSIQAAQNDLAFIVKYPLQEGLSKTINWYQETGWL